MPFRGIFLKGFMFSSRLFDDVHPFQKGFLTSDVRSAALIIFLSIDKAPRTPTGLFLGHELGIRVDVDLIVSPFSLSWPFRSSKAHRWTNI